MLDLTPLRMVDGKFEGREKLAVQQFQRVINGISDGNATGGLVDGIVSKDGISWGWLNAYNAPHWMNLGAQMQNGSLPGWDNTQKGIRQDHRDVEFYGTSWIRDLMRAKSFALPVFLANVPSTGSRFNGAVDANFGISLDAHSTHGAGMNFDLGIKYSYITGIFLTSAAVAGPVIDTNLPSKPTDGVWSNQYVLDLNNPVGPDGPRVVLPNEENSDGKNYQINALYDFLSLYSVTRDNGNKSNGWDDLPVNNGSATQKEIIRNALFGDGTASGSLIRSVAIGGTGTQAPYERMKDVLRALDVPPNVSRNGTEYNVIGHYNHFHLNIQPPTKKPVEIGGSGNLLAAATTMTDASTSRAADVPVTSQAQYDATFSICQAVAPVGGQDFPVANQLYPHAAATAFFNARGIALEQSEPTKIMLVEVPRHGGLVPDTKFPHSVFVYHPNEGYFGSDQMTFSVEVKGKIFKVVYSVDVVRAPDYGSPDCPTGFDIKELPDSATGNGKGSSLDIIELPTDGSVDVEALAKLHSIVSFSLGADSLGDGGSFSFANLR